MTFNKGPWPDAPVGHREATQIGFGTPSVEPHACGGCQWADEDPHASHGNWRRHRFDNHRLESPVRCGADCLGALGFKQRRPA